MRAPTHANSNTRPGTIGKWGLPQSPRLGFDPRSSPRLALRPSPFAHFDQTCMHEHWGGGRTYTSTLGRSLQMMF